MIDGTATISIEELDRFRLMEQAILERKVVEKHSSYTYGNSSVVNYFVLDENKVLEDAVRDANNLSGEVNRLKYDLSVLEREVMDLRRYKNMATPKRKWWQL